MTEAHTPHARIAQRKAQGVALCANEHVGFNGWLAAGHVMLACWLGREAHYLAWAIPAIGFVGTVRGLAGAFGMAGVVNLDMTTFTKQATDQLMIAFEKIPGITLPVATATNAARLFELRTYESPSDLDHKRKVEMMQSGEEKIFDKAGFTQVFYGDTLIGGHIPNLTYMLSFENLAARDQHWTAFGTSPDWKTMQANPRYAFENIVSNISNFILTPAAYSQI